MQDVKSRHGATLELCLTTNMAAKGICQQEELASFIAILASGKPEDLDAYCGKDKVIRIYNNFQLGLVGNTMLTLPDGYTLDGMGHNLTVTGGSLTISGDVSELCINGKKQKMQPDQRLQTGDGSEIPPGFGVICYYRPLHCRDMPTVWGFSQRIFPLCQYLLSSFDAGT